MHTLTNDDLKNAEILASTFIRSVGKRAIDNWKNIEVEYHIDQVDVTTSMDKEIEKEFALFVENNFPEHGFSGEEFKSLKKDAEYVWYIDPIDGTKFYAKHVPFWSVSIALVRKGIPVLGLIYNPISDQLYHARDGHGAYLNDKAITIDPETDLSKLQIALDVSFTGDEYYTRKETLTPLLEKLFITFYRVRMLGSGTYSITWLSQGFFGCYLNLFRTEEKMYDIYPGMLIAKEAGAYIHKVVVRKGLYHFLFGNERVVKTIAPMIERLT